nr:MAG TPA: hypothetical protein [Bacteriophage sp.]
MRGIDHADPLQHHPHHAHLPRHPTQDTTTATRTTHQHAPWQIQARATPPTTTGPEDMRHTHPTTRSHRSPPERPTAHTQASTRTHSRQAVSGPHTHAQPRHRDHEHHEHTSQPPRPSPPTPGATTTKHQHKKTRARTTAARTARNALTSANTKHHATEITENQKQNPRHPRE